jgi:hypothetical protein
MAIQVQRIATGYDPQNKDAQGNQLQCRWDLFWNDANDNATELRCTNDTEFVGRLDVTRESDNTSVFTLITQAHTTDSVPIPQTGPNRLRMTWVNKTSGKYSGFGRSILYPYFD